MTPQDYLAVMTRIASSNKDIGDRLRLFRERWMGISGTAMAERYNMRQSRYSNWENGQRRLSLDFAFQLYLEHGVTLDWLYLGREETLPHSVRMALGLITLDRR